MSELHNTDPTPEFAGFTYFRSCAGNIQVLPQRPDDDASQLPTDEALNELLADVKRGISDPSEVDGDQATAASRLREQRSAYVPLDEATINSEFAGIVAGFGGTPGLVLMPGGKKTLIWLPATKYADGRVARLMSGPPVDDVEAFAGRLSLIAPPTWAETLAAGLCMLPILPSTLRTRQ